MSYSVDIRNGVRLPSSNPGSSSDVGQESSSLKFAAEVLSSISVSPVCSSARENRTQNDVDIRQRRTIEQQDEIIKKLTQLVNSLSSTNTRSGRKIKSLLGQIKILEETACSSNEKSNRKTNKLRKLKEKKRELEDRIQFLSEILNMQNYELNTERYFQALFGPVEDELIEFSFGAFFRQSEEPSPEEKKRKGKRTAEERLSAFEVPLPRKRFKVI